LLVRVRGESEPSWELVHDSLVPRVLSWIDRKDLARRRAIELLRYHLRRCTADQPSLLGRKELRELAAHRGAVEELDEEWQKREGHDHAWTPSGLVSLSRQGLRRRAMVLSSIIVAALAIGSAGFYKSYVEGQRTAQEESLRERNLGRFVLSLEPFDWDPGELRSTPAPLPGLIAWKLRVPERHDDNEPGDPFDDLWLVRGPSHLAGVAQLSAVESHGGAAFLEVERPCGPSLIPLRLPGYADRERELPVFHVHVPTCAASRVDMIQIPAGTFVYRGVGEPPASDAVRFPSISQERTLDEPAFAIDRTEVTNAAFEVFGEMTAITNIPRPTYVRSTSLTHAAEPRKPVTNVGWSDLRAYCRFLGKDLPTSRQWTKALRGGLVIAGAPNPMPRRNLPWGVTASPRPARVVYEQATSDDDGPADVATYPIDRSPYGVMDLAGNAYEWTRTPDGSGRVTRGANWGETLVGDIVNWCAIENPRPPRRTDYGLGGRCATP
jgi:eukaryotic-like serine/threonine-protein kinase